MFAPRSRTCWCPGAPVGRPCRTARVPRGTAYRPGGPPRRPDSTACPGSRASHTDALPPLKRSRNCLLSWSWISRCCTGEPPKASSSSTERMAAAPDSSWKRNSVGDRVARLDGQRGSSPRATNPPTHLRSVLAEPEEDVPAEGASVLAGVEDDVGVAGVELAVVILGVCDGREVLKRKASSVHLALGGDGRDHGDASGVRTSWARLYTDRPLVECRERGYRGDTHLHPPDLEPGLLARVAEGGSGGAGARGRGRPGRRGRRALGGEGLGQGERQRRRQRHAPHGALHPAGRAEGRLRHASTTKSKNYKRAVRVGRLVLSSAPTLV
ncbi:hypothetical protein FOCC_FOCC002029, partial [Frankliniella occidentalis]